MGTASKVLSYFGHQPFSEARPAIDLLNMYIDRIGEECFKENLNF